MEYTGWLLDLYACPRQGVALWLLGDDGLRRRLHQPFPVCFYAAGPAPRLRALWRFLQAQPASLALGRVERRDLFCDQPLTVLSVQVAQAADQPRLFQQVSASFPDLSYYDADIAISLRYAAVHGVFPLARCRVRVDEAGQVLEIAPLDSPWDLDPIPPPLCSLSLEPDTDPAHAPPTALNIRCGRYDYRLSLEPTRPLLVGLRAILQRHDPDMLLTSWGDAWLLPYLLERSRRCQIPLPFNREPGREVEHRPENTYFSYGQVIYRGKQTLLFGRWHIDRYNAMLFHDYGLDGVLELARVTALPVQTAARVSPGSGISAMQMLTALRLGVLVPWHKQQAERPKTALDLLRADQGGLVYQPVIGLHRDVAEIDFVSMYPGIMVRFNISPETVGTSEAIARSAHDLGWFAPPAPQAGVRQIPPSGRFLQEMTEESGMVLDGKAAPYDLENEAEHHRGLVPQTLAPLLEKRLALKARLASLPAWHPNHRPYKARASAHKWLLVTCFGYLGYKNARFGRIEAHEAVTAYGREALLRAKETAEDLGYEVLHLYVDGMWVRRPGASAPADFEPLLDEIVERTGLPISLEGVYRWVAFLPSRIDERVPVANRYFGVFQDGSLKVRGIEARRRDTPPFIAQIQAEILQALAQPANGPPLPAVFALLRRKMAALRAGRVALEDLLVAQKLSRALGEYRSPSPVARAVVQLEAAGKPVSPGQRVRFLYTRGEPGVYAWDLPQSPQSASVHTARYGELLLRAAGSVLGPFGVSEEQLRLVLAAPTSQHPVTLSRLW